jgi:hypothetical protein
MILTGGQRTGVILNTNLDNECLGFGAVSSKLQGYYLTGYLVLPLKWQMQYYLD